MTAVNDGTDDRVADTYKGHLLEKRTYANGVYLTHLDNNGQYLSGYGYDTFGRLKNHRWKDDGGSLLAGWSHDYDRIGNKKYQEDLQSATQSELYGYDTVYRLDDFKRGQLNEAKTDVTNPSRTQTWTLDPLGNWDDTVLESVTESRVHSDVNELTQRTIGQGGAIDLSYDDAGNLIQDGSANGDHQYVYDYRNRLVQAKEKQDGNWNTVGTYKYDPQGRRVRKVVTNKGALNGTTRFVWGGDSDWQCLEERDGDDDLVARFTYSPGYIDAVAVQERDLNADTDFADTNEVVYYQANTLFSVYALSDSSGSVIERYRYDAYSGCTVLDADGSADADGLSDVKNPYTFTGRRLDPETGLMQYRHRNYSAALGRFITHDPLGYTDSHALYGYVGGRPVSRLDSLGLSGCSAPAPTVPPGWRRARAIFPARSPDERDREVGLPWYYQEGPGLYIPEMERIRVIEGKPLLPGGRWWQTARFWVPAHDPPQRCDAGEEGYVREVWFPWKLRWHAPSPQYGKRPPSAKQGNWLRLCPNVDCWWSKESRQIWCYAGWWLAIGGGSARTWVEKGVPITTEDYMVTGEPCFLQEMTIPIPLPYPGGGYKDVGPLRPIASGKWTPDADINKIAKACMHRPPPGEWSRDWTPPPGITAWPPTRPTPSIHRRPRPTH